jgi:hypothetical protein
LGLRTLQFLDIYTLPYRLNPIAANRDSVLAQNRIELPRRRHPGVNIRVDVNGIRLWPGGSLRLTARRILRLQRRQTTKAHNEGNNETRVPHLSRLLREVGFQ